MKIAVPVCLLVVIATIAPSRAFGGTRFQPKFEVIPVEVDNQNFVVAAFWRSGLGCLPPPQLDPGCPNPFDPDPTHQGLLLAKSNLSGTPLTPTPGKAVAIIKGVKGTFLDEVGYDLRKFISGAADPRTGILSPKGSECTETSPRFEFQMADGQNFYIPCELMLETELVSNLWRRVRGTVAQALPSTQPIRACPFPVTKGATTTSCNIPISCTDPNTCGLSKRMQSLRIVHDVFDSEETQENFGVAIFDNIDVNGRLKGSGPGPRNGDEDEGQGRDKDGREFYHLDSPSHPEQGQFEYHDPVANVNLVGINGVRGIAYSVGPLGQPCVSFSGDGTVNSNPGYLYTFASCDLSAVGTDLGTYSITITGPIGTLPYNQTGSLLMGSVDIHK